jgi:serine/threonine-protein kinase SRPK3
MQTIRKILLGPPVVECPEENLHLTQNQGFGFYPGSPGQKLKDGYYDIIRKLGRGRCSSTWLVSYTVYVCFYFRCLSASLTLPTRTDKKAYKAMKILTAKATEMIRCGMLNELDVLQTIMTSHPYSAVLPRLRDHFFTTGPHGEHLCLVLDLLSTDVGAFRLSSPTKTLALHIVQKVAGDMVEALKELHSINIIHTGALTGPLMSRLFSDFTLNRCQARQHAFLVQSKS